MIIVLKPDISDQELEHIVETVKEWGLTPNVSKGVERSIVGLIGDEAVIASKPLDRFPGVDHVMPVSKPYKRASAEFHAEHTQIVLPAIGPNGREVVIGGREQIVMAGPCSIENLELTLDLADVVKRGGGHIYRGGAFKPRTSPYSFQGLGKAGLEMMVEARNKFGIPIISEVMDVRNLELVAGLVDVLQIGARNMQNFDLLRELGKCGKPVMIKRGLSSTIEELLMSAEYVLSHGNPDVILCERGIRTFEPKTRNTVDISAVPVIRRESHLPIIVDPSHGTGHWDLVVPVARAAIAAGADGIMVEIHPNPEMAPCDGSQALLPKTYIEMMKQLRGVSEAIGRTLGEAG